MLNIKTNVMANSVNNTTTVAPGGCCCCCCTCCFALGFNNGTATAGASGSVVPANAGK